MNTRKARRQIAQARVMLGRLELVRSMLEPPREQGGGVIDMVEVSPGVYAPKAARRAGLAGLLDQAEELLTQADELETRSRKLGGHR